MKKVGIARLPLNRKEKLGPSARIGTMDIVICIILALFALAIVLPFYYLFVVSITPEEIYANNPTLLYTPKVTFEAYINVFNDV